MSRLEQMREHFLQKIYYEQQQQYFMKQPKPRLSSASSIQNLSSPFKKSACPVQSQVRRPPNRMQSMSSVKINTINRNGSNTFQARPNITRVKSLCNVNLLAQGSKVNGTNSNNNNNNSNNNNNNNNNNNSNNNNSNNNSNNNNNNSHSRYSQHRPSAAGLNVSKTNPNQPSNDNQINQSKPPNNNNNNNNNSVNKNTRVHRPAKSLNVSRTHSVQETKRAAANKNKVVPECKYCNRKFAAKERLDKHMEICEKTFKKQRPVFNSAKQRFLILQQQQQQQQEAAESGQKAEQKPETSLNDNANNSEKSSEISKKPNWKESRQQFLKAIKEAKQKRLEEPKNDNNCDGNDNQVIYKENRMLEDSGPEAIDIVDQILHCSYCKRKFSPNVITKHETICGKLFRKQNYDIC